MLLPLSGAMSGSADNRALPETTHYNRYATFEVHCELRDRHFSPPLTSAFVSVAPSHRDTSLLPTRHPAMRMTATVSPPPRWRLGDGQGVLRTDCVACH